MWNSSCNLTRGRNAQCHYSVWYLVTLLMAVGYCKHCQQSRQNLAGCNTNNSSPSCWVLYPIINPHDTLINFYYVLYIDRHIGNLSLHRVSSGKCRLSESVPTVGKRQGQKHLCRITLNSEWFRGKRINSTNTLTLRINCLIFGIYSSDIICIYRTRDILGFNMWSGAENLILSPFKNRSSNKESNTVSY